MNTKVDKPVLIRREVTRYGRVGDLFTVYLDDDDLWCDDSVCEGDFVICTKRDVSSYTSEISGLTYKLMVKEHNSTLGKSLPLNINERRYLSGVIGPFRDKVTGIIKVTTSCGEKSYISIRLGNAMFDDRVNLPYFNSNSMYLKMETGRMYHLDELGL